MRTLFCSTRGEGHIRPLLPFLRACAEAGHEVALAGPADLEPHARDAGVAHLPVDRPPDAQLGPLYAKIPSLSPEEANRVVVGDIFARHNVGAALPRLRDHLDTFRPQLIVRESQEYASVIAGALSRIPVVRVALMLGVVEHGAMAIAREPLGEIAEALGATLRDLSATPCYSLLPASFEDSKTPGLAAIRRARLPRRAAHPLPAKWWKKDESPLVYSSFGSVAGGMTENRSAYQAAVEAAAEIDARVLLTTGLGFDASELGALPSNVHVEAWVPQEDVFDHASAVLCHGGSGTVSGALAAGLPLVVLPLFADQPFNCDRVEKTGVGLGVRSPSSDALAEALQRILAEESFGDRARAMAGEIASHLSIQEVVEELEEVAAAW